jgi:hypothetical protein
MAGKGSGAGLGEGQHAKDPGYRGGFGPLPVTLEMDAWQPASKTSRWRSCWARSSWG